MLVCCWFARTLLCRYQSIAFFLCCYAVARVFWMVAYWTLKEPTCVYVHHENQRIAALNSTHLHWHSTVRFSCLQNQIINKGMTICLEFLHCSSRTNVFWPNELVILVYMIGITQTQSKLLDFKVKSMLDGNPVWAKTFLNLKHFSDIFAWTTDTMWLQ